MKNFILFFSVLIFAGLACNSSPADNTNGDQIDLSPKEFKAKMSASNTIVLDVRTPAEIAQGKIPGAFDLDIRNPAFKGEVDKLDKAKTYLIYCKSGGRSGRACSIFKDAGFEKIYNLEGGYDGWKSEMK